jgi:hypothetical protein
MFVSVHQTDACGMTADPYRHCTVLFFGLSGIGLPFANVWTVDSRILARSALITDGHSQDLRSVRHHSMSMSESDHGPGLDRTRLFLKKCLCSPMLVNFFNFQQTHTHETRPYNNPGRCILPGSHENEAPTIVMALKQVRCI